MGNVKKNNLRISRLILIFILTSMTLLASMFTCQKVESYSELSDVRVGFPLNFISINFQRYTPINYPAKFCGPSSIWEDSQRILIFPFIFNFIVIYILYLVVNKLYSSRKN